MKKISIIGAGNIGGILGLFCVQHSIGRVHLFDRNKGILSGKVLDLAQAFGSKNVYSCDSYEDLKDSDVIVVTAGLTRKPGMTRDDLTKSNADIVSNIGESIKKYAKNAFVIVVTNPLDVMTWMMYKTTMFSRNMVIGMAGGLDSSRFKYFLSEKLDVSVNDIETVILGGHGDTMLPLISHTSISGTPLLEWLKIHQMDEDILKPIIDRTRDGGAEIVNLTGTSAYYAPAISIFKIIKSYIFDEKRIHQCCAYLDNDYNEFDSNAADLCVGVPVIIGKSGVEKIIKLSLRDDEKIDFSKSINAVKQSVENLKNLTN